jgi:tetratricopeptide (TPR) repeat protein
VLYLILPLSIASVAALGIVAVVWRKMPYLRKLTPESHEVGDTLFHDFAPEVVDWFRGVPWRRYVHDVLVAFEQFLHRARGAMTAVDRVSSQLVRKVRQVHEKTAQQHEQVVAQLEQEKQERATEPDPDAVDFDNPEQLKQEEQRLIVAIAQNPKDAALYSDLARISLRLGNTKDAVEAMEQATKLEPKNEQYLKRLERARARLEKSPAN